MKRVKRVKRVTNRRSCYPARSMRTASIALFASASAVAAVTMLAACNRRPDWSKPPEGGISGDSTVAGAPMSIVRFASPPTIDGKLDEPVWQGAKATARFVNPGNGQTPGSHPVAAFARLGWDEKNLYLGVVVDDDAPAAPFGRDDVDPHLWEMSSAVELMLQPGDPGDNREYYEMQFDTMGAMFDTKWDDYNQPISGSDPATKKFGHMEWSCKAERAAFVQRGKLYSIEVAIPWSSFTSSRVAVPPKPGDVWRANLYSFRDGQKLALAWSPIKGEGNFHKSSRFGRVKFE